MTLTGSNTTAVGPFVERVQRMGQFGRLRAAVESGGRVHVTGLRGSALVLLIEALRARLGRRVLVVYPEDESAADAFSDFRTLSSGRSVLLPDRDIFPQRFESRENLVVRGDRNEALLAIQSDTADVVVTSLLGFLEKTVPKDSLAAHRKTIPRRRHTRPRRPARGPYRHGI